MEIILTLIGAGFLVWAGALAWKEGLTEGFLVRLALGAAFTALARTWGA
jgi:hypothetical protein